MKKEIFNQYLDRVCSLFKITREELLSKSRKTGVVDAKQLLVYLCHRRQMRLVTIKEYFDDIGYKIDNKGVLYCIRVVDKKINEDRDYKTIIREIEESVHIN